MDLLIAAAQIGEILAVPDYNPGTESVPDSELPGQDAEDALVDGVAYFALSALAVLLVPTALISLVVLIIGFATNRQRIQRISGIVLALSLSLLLLALVAAVVIGLAAG
jgi:hypothetical protein